MAQKISLVAGSYSGIGAKLCKQLLENGEDLILLNRSAGATEAQAASLQTQFPDRQISTYLADFSNTDDIRAAAKKIALTHNQINAIYYVAGALTNDPTPSADGFEMHFAVNCLAPVLLVKLLSNQLAAAGKASAVIAGSAARNMARNLDIDSLAYPPTRPVRGMKLYAQSKQAIAAAFHTMRGDLSASGINPVVVDIPPTKTNMASSKVLPLPFRIARSFFAKPEKSAWKLFEAGHTSSQNAQPRNLPPEATCRSLSLLLDKLTTSRQPSGVESEFTIA